jgi:hypothetical protein
MVTLELAEVTHGDTGFFGDFAKGQVFDLAQLAQLLTYGRARVERFIRNMAFQMFVRGGQADCLDGHVELLDA